MVLNKNLGSQEATDEDFENIMSIDRNVYQRRDYLNGFELKILRQMMASKDFHLKKFKTVKRVHAFTSGFWQCMDTKRDKLYLEKIYKVKKSFK